MNGVFIDAFRYGFGLMNQSMDRRIRKALAEYFDITLGDLLEGIVLHAFDGKCPFGEESLTKIKDIKRIYDLELNADASHLMEEN